MSAQTEDSAAPPAVPASSPRSRLARVALHAVMRLDEVGHGVAGPQRVWATIDAGELLRGVVAAARPDGRFDLELHLVAQWPVGPLDELADRARARVQREARRAGLDDVLGAVAVAFEDVREPRAGGEGAG